MIISTKDINTAMFQSIATIAPTMDVNEFHDIVNRGSQLDEVCKADPKIIALGVAWFYKHLMQQTIEVTL